MLIQLHIELHKKLFISDAKVKMVLVQKKTGTSYNVVLCAYFQ